MNSFSTDSEIIDFPEYLNAHLFHGFALYGGDKTTGDSSDSAGKDKLEIMSAFIEKFFSESRYYPSILCCNIATVTRPNHFRFPENGTKVILF